MAQGKNMTSTAPMTKKEQADFQIKSGLAKLLAMENISVQHMPGASTAAFDIKNRQLFLPVWQNISNDLYDLLVVHEVGHALNTPAKAWMDAIKEIAKRSHGDKSTPRAEKAIKLFMNVVEDARIDKLQKRKYPGSRKNYLAGYKELLERDFFGIKNKNINALTFIDRANIYYKGGLQNLNIQFTPEERELLARMDKLETFDDVIELTEEIYNLSKTNSKTITVSSDFEEGEDEDGEGYYTEIETDDDAEDAEDEKVSDLKGKGEGDDEEDEGDEDSEDGDGESDGDDEDEAPEDVTNAKKNDRGGKTDNKDHIPECQTEENAERNAASLIANDDYNYIYCNIPKFHHEYIVDDFSLVVPEMEKSIDSRLKYYKSRYPNEPERHKDRAMFRESFNTWKSKEKDAINYMIKEFEMRKSADTYARQSIAKTGVIDTNKLHSYKFNDDIFRRLTVVPQGKNHGFVMLLDWSSSMTSELKATIKQLFSMVMFCKKVQIPFEVYTFRMPNNAEHAAVGYGHALDNKQFTVIENSLRFSAFKLRNVFSSRMNLTMLNRAYENLWILSSVYIDSDPMDSTPLNQAILALDKIVNDFRVRNKLQIVSTIVLTDGSSDPLNGVNVRQALPRKKGNRYILQDDVTKKTYYFDGDPYYWNYRATEVFLNILRDRTQTNLVGFYLMSGKTIGYHVPGVDSTHTQGAAAQEFWKKNNFLGVPGAGYDEYYLMNANALSKDSDMSLNVSSNMSSKKMVKEFSKYFGRKSINKVLLGRFIDRIANERKRA